MDTRRAVGAMLVALIAIGAAFAMVPSHSVPIQDEVPVTTDDTPTVVLASDGTTDVDLVNMWEGDQLNITTAEGNITVSGDPGASARLHVTDIEGGETQVTQIDAGANWIELDPDDKNRLDVRGDADTLAFSEIGVDDGNTDIQIGGPSGGSAELRLHGLAANSDYALYDASRDEVLGHVETDGSGTGTADVDLPDGTHSLEVRSADDLDGPTLSNPRPEGEVTELPDELAVDVDANAYPVEVEFTLEGEHVETVELTEDGTATADVDVSDLGEYEWSATATDAIGQTDTLETSFVTPRELTIREEHDPETVVDANVTIRFFSTGGDIVIREQTDDGTLDMEGLPNTDFVVYIESENHYNRTVYIGSIFEQQDMFVLNETEFDRGQNDAIRSRFVYEDLTGQFPREDTVIQIQRAVDMDGDGEHEWRTVSGDFWGAAGEFEDVLERGERYRIVITNVETGREDNLGTHIPTEDLTHELRTSGLVQEAQNATGVVGLAEFNESQGTIEWAYHDPANETDHLHVTVEPRTGGEPIHEETVDGPLGTHSGVLQLNESQQEQDWVVTFESNRHRSAIPVGSGTVGLPVPVPGWLLTLLMSMAVTFVGALYGPRTALLGAWAMVFVSAGVMMFGWAFSGASVLVAALVAVGVTFVHRALP